MWAEDQNNDQKSNLWNCHTFILKLIDLINNKPVLKCTFERIKACVIDTNIFFLSLRILCLFFICLNYFILGLVNLIRSLLYNNEDYFESHKHTNISPRRDKVDY